MNGWTNYATWRVNMEIVEDLVQYDIDDVSMYENEAELTQSICDQVHQMMEDSPELSAEYAKAFLRSVNWAEIAKHHWNDINGRV